MTRRSPFSEEVGSAETTTPTTCPYTTRWGVGSPRTTSSTPTPTQPGEDVGHLINTLVSGLCLASPQRNTFSGEATPGKTEVWFEQWYHKVQYVKDHYPELVVWKSIVRSLKGAAADMARYMGPTASLPNILQKLTVIFGMVMSFDILMQFFFQSYMGKPQESALLHHKAGGDFKSNSTQMTWTDSWSQGAMAPQRLPFPWGSKTHKGFHSVSLQ